MRILLVDDSPLFLALVTFLLCMERGIEVVGQAQSGDEALEQATRLRPDLVLMDWTLPGLNGLEATRRLKAQPNPPRVVILTLHDATPYRWAAAEAGADGFIAKGECATHLLALLAIQKHELTVANA